MSRLCGVCVCNAMSCDQRALCWAPQTMVVESAVKETWTPKNMLNFCICLCTTIPALLIKLHMVVSHESCHLTNMQHTFYVELAIHPTWTDHFGRVESFVQHRRNTFCMGCSPWHGKTALHWLMDIRHVAEHPFCVQVDKPTQREPLCMSCPCITYRETRFAVASWSLTMADLLLTWVALAHPTCCETHFARWATLHDDPPLSLRCVHLIWQTTLCGLLIQHDQPFRSDGPSDTATCFPLANHPMHQTGF